MKGRGSHVAEAFSRGAVHKGRTVNATWVSWGIRRGNVGYKSGGDLFHKVVPDVDWDVCRDAGF